MRIVTAGMGLRAGHVLGTLLAEMPEAKVVGYYDPNPTHLEMLGGGDFSDGGRLGLQRVWPGGLSAGHFNQRHDGIASTG